MISQKLITATAHRCPLKVATLLLSWLLMLLAGGCGQQEQTCNSEKKAETQKAPPKNTTTAPGNRPGFIAADYPSWIYSYEQGLKLARQTNRPLLIELHTGAG
jgi:hypothetical protein